MRPRMWRPPVELSPAEQAVIKAVRRARLFVFLREHRHELFDEVSETWTLITTLLDHQAAPAPAVREAYLTRWSASETMFGEDKTTINGAGNRTSGPVLRSGSPRLAMQEA